MRSERAGDGRPTGRTARPTALGGHLARWPALAGMCCRQACACMQGAEGMSPSLMFRRRRDLFCWLCRKQLFGVVAHDVHRTRAVAAGAARRAEAWTAPRGCAARAWHGGGSAIAQLAHGHPECVAAAAAARPAVEAAAVFVVVVATAAPAIKAAAAWAGAAVTHRQRRSRRHELAAGLARDESRANTGRHARLAAS